MRKIFYVHVLVILLSTLSQAKAADSGSCGENCTYNYDPETKNLVFSPIDSSKEAIVANSTYYYGLSGSVNNVIVSEGITSITQSGPVDTIYDLGNNIGTLTLPKTLSHLDKFALGGLKFANIIINSENLNFGKSTMNFSSSNPTVVLSADSNVTFDEEFFHHANNGGWYIPNSLKISCKGDPDVCAAKFGNALDHITGPITADYYEERDGNGNLTLKYDDRGYNKYDSDGNITERWNLDSTEQYDRKGHVIATYDGKGNLLQSFVYGADNSVSIYDKSGKLIGIQGKRILTVDEASALVKDNKNTFTLKYR